MLPHTLLPQAMKRLGMSCHAQGRVKPFDMINQRQEFYSSLPLRFLITGSFDLPDYSGIIMFSSFKTHIYHRQSSPLS